MLYMIGCLKTNNSKKKRILTAHLAIFPAGTYEDFYRLNKCMENLIIFTYSFLFNSL